jgi:hypothetical protein
MGQGANSKSGARRTDTLNRSTDPMGGDDERGFLLPSRDLRRD